MEREAALPFIRFWLDVESFRSSIEPLPGHQYQQNFKSSHNKHDPNVERGMRRSISFDGIVPSNQIDFCNAYKSDDCEYTENNPSDLPTERDDGDGSSDANSMTNLSDICETEIDFFENGRKSATGASSHGECMDSTFEKSACNVKKNLPTSSIIDAIRIFKKYLLNGEITDLVKIPTNILSQISLLLCVQNEPMTKYAHTEALDSQMASSNELILMAKAQFEGSNITTVFDEAQAFVLDHLDENYTNGFLQSQFFYRYCKENIGSNLQITDILYNETALFFFMEFLELQSKQKYLEFWLAAMNYRRQWDSSQSFETNEAIDITNRNKQNQNDALILYEKYFSLQATQPLHLSNRIRFHVEEKICSIDECAMVQYCFDLPLVIVERFLDQRFLRIFKKSNLFFKYLNEMLHKFETTNSALTFSAGLDTGLTLDCSPRNPSTKIDGKQNSISTKNTLLAMENVKKRNHRRIPSAGSDMCIDSRQLHDPDLLWRRKTTNGLIFGRVNSLGRYERDYDITPIDKNTSNIVPGSVSHDANQILQSTGDKIKRAVRKLVHLPEQCMQEELAWQMAEMIINDVTSVTLKPNQSPISKGYKIHEQ